MKLPQRDRDVLIVLRIRELLVDEAIARKPLLLYKEIAAELPTRFTLDVNATEVERAIKADVRNRWQHHLPQMFRPGWGAERGGEYHGCHPIAARLAALDSRIEPLAAPKRARVGVSGSASSASTS
ncbi:hypothetical protein KEG38_23895 [Polyangium jinanense]|uniref:hypothetical protein n=1 Tax=Polyangium jinanense TaxID=2829994 RepID=UPI0023426A49|nr:hypothetical protein [Polyangium jinanense]MDC3956924.1 hypothetical protein [Polyangium jinanense]